MSNFPSGAGPASVSIYSGSGRVRNVIAGVGLRNKTCVLILGNGGEGIGGETTHLSKPESSTEPLSVGYCWNR